MLYYNNQDTGLFPDTNIALALGQIVECDCPRGLYKIRPLISSRGAASELWATPIASSILTNDVRTTIRYRVGDYVIYTQAADPMHDTYMQTSVIIGNYNNTFIPNMTQVPDATENISRKSLNTPVDAKHNSIQETLNAFSNRTLTTTGIVNNYDIQDSISGDYIRTGSNTLLLQDNNLIHHKAGNASISINALTSTISEACIIKNSVSANTKAITNVIGDTTLDLKYTVGNLRSAYKNGLEIHNNAVYKVKDWKPVYRRCVSSGDCLAGTHKTTYLLDDETAVADTFECYNGAKAISTASGLKLIKKPNIQVPKYVGASIEAADSNVSSQIVNRPDGVALTPSAENNDALMMFEHLKDSNLWSFKDTNLIDTPYSLLEQSAALYENDFLTLGDGDDSLETVNNEAMISLEPDGSIVLRDGWGSEIVMSHGNIQMFSAGNLIGFSGRDTLLMSGGATTVSAEDVLSMESSIDGVNIKADKDLKLLGGNNKADGVVIQANGGSGLQLLGGTSATLMATDITLANKSDYTNTALAQGGSILLATNGVIHQQAHVIDNKCIDSFSVINNAGCAFVLQANYVVTYCDTLKCSGNMIVSEASDKTLKVTQLDNGKVSTTEQPVLSATAPSILSAGDVCVSGNVLCDTDGWFGGSVAAYVLAHTAKSDSVNKVSKATLNKVTTLSNKARFKAFTITLKQLASTPLLKRAFKALQAGLRKGSSKLWLFKHIKQSTAFQMYVPLWCERTSGRKRVETAVADSYIYPGKEFWKGTGAKASKGIVYGVTNITVNTKNVTTN